MAVLFDSFETWKNECSSKELPLYQPVLEFEMNQKGSSEESIWLGVQQAYQVMKDAVNSGLVEDMSSHSGMIKNGAKKVYSHPKAVLSKEFQNLISRALAA